MLHPGPGRARTSGTRAHRGLRLTRRRPLRPVGDDLGVRLDEVRPLGDDGGEPPDGVSLRRLLEVTRLTPAQALTIAADLLAELDGPVADGAGGGSGPRGAVSVDTVLVGGDGGTRLVTAAHGGPDRRGAAEVLGELARAAGRPVAAETAAPAAPAVGVASAAAVAVLERAAAGTRGPDAVHGPAQRDATRRDPAQGGPAQGGPARGDPARGDPAQGDPAQGDPAQKDVAHDEPDLRDPVPSGPALSVVAARLREAASDAAVPDRTRAELARLVAAVQGRNGTPPGLAPLGAPGGSAPPAGSLTVPRVTPPPVPPRPPLREAGRRAAGRAWKGALTLLVLAALVAVEVAVLDDRIASDIATVLEAGRSAPASTAPADETAPPAPDPPPPPEPAAAGTVAALDVRTVGPCEPGAPCEVRLHVLTDPVPQPQTVTWAFRVSDRCTGATTLLPGGTLDLPPGADRADPVQTLDLPPGAALAVTAVTARPAVAASRPLPGPASASCGPSDVPRGD
ncbi:MAG TPA: hypothetical protein VD813_04475 [Pseudonocardia sp.]|nr:hypothetical protein [Pseudonocardia sp.]